MRLGCYSILILFSIIGATNAQQQLDRNDDLTSRVYRNRDAVVFHDEYGNKILDGRSTKTDDFEIHFTPSYEYGNKLYIEFCAKDIGCDEERGLILCWEAPKWLKRNMTYSSNARIEYLQAECGYYHGVMVTTVKDGNHFRVDTVYGNTYEFVISTVPNCFTLWLFGFDPYPGTRKQMTFTKKKRAVVNAWYPKLRSRNALSLILDNDGSNNGLPLDHPGDFDEKHRIRDLSGNPIVMKDEEIQIAAEARRFWQSTKGDFETHHFTANFKAQGGGGCCNLTAKIMGKQLSKCYFHWKDVYRCKDTCSEILKYGFHPKPLYGSLSMGPTTIDSVSPETTSPETTQDVWNDLPDTETTDLSALSTTTTAPTANPKWIQYVNDPEERTELEKQFGAYLTWNPAKYPDVSRAALYLLGNYFSSFFSHSSIGGYHTETPKLTRLQSEGRFELLSGKNESIDIPPDEQNDNYWGEIRQVVFRCLGIQIDTDESVWYDNSNEEKKEWENMQNSLTSLKKSNVLIEKKGKLTRLQSEGRFVLQAGKNESIDIPPDEQNDNYWGEIRQVVFSCLGIQIDTDISFWFDNSNEEKKNGRTCRIGLASDGQPFLSKELSKCYFHWKDLFRCNNTINQYNNTQTECGANVAYGYHPKPIYSTTVAFPSANPKWFQYVITDPEEQTELEKNNLALTCHGILPNTLLCPELLSH